MTTYQRSSNRNSRKRTTSSGKNKTNSKSRKKTTPNKPYKDEIFLVITLMISVLLVLSNFNLAGVVGNVINNFVFGSLGFLAYIIPYLLFIGVAFYVSNRGNKVAIKKLIYVTVMFIVLSGLLQMITMEYKRETKLLEYYIASAKDHSGGGIIGGAISKALCHFFGEVGTYVILVALLIILFILITEKLIFDGIRNRSSQTVESIKEKNRKYQNEKDKSNAREDLTNQSVPQKKAKTFTFPKSFKKKKETLAEKEGVVADATPIFQEELAKKFNNQKDYNIANLADVVINNPGDNEKPLAVEFPYQEGEAGQYKIPDEGSVNPIPVPSVSRKARNVKKTTNQGKIEDIQVSEGQVGLKGNYIFPSIELLSKPKKNVKGMTDKELKDTAMKLQSTLESFGVRVTITNVSCGPAVTRYELQPEQGVKVSKITNLADDIKLNLAAADVRIEAPIPGKAAVGIEVPNKENSVVMFRSLIESNDFKNHKSNIAFAVGKDIGGQTVVTDIGKMPHLLIAGATGSGKSVCINTIIMSILYKSNPEDVKMIMVDPKVVELSVYNGIPHLLIPVVTDPKKASAALNWAVMEMTDRYNKFADLGVRDMKGYNDKVEQVKEDNDEKYKKLPQIVIIVDELADLMMVAPGEVEDAICRLAQMARAAGLHLIIATQRPSVNVITGLIKANIPSRIAFSVSSSIDSRTIIDGSGAEKLLGKGDMLFFPSGYPKPVRIQGAFVSDKEVSSVVEYLASQNKEPKYQEEIADKINSAQILASSATESNRDDYFLEAGKFIIEKDKASIGMLQRVYKIGFNRAARIMDQLCEAGVVGPEEGTKPRKVLMSPDEFQQFSEEYL